MLAFTVDFPGQEGIRTAYCVRSRDQAVRLSKALNGADIHLVDVTDREIIAYLLSEEADAEAERIIARVIKRKN